MGFNLQVVIDAISSDDPIYWGTEDNQPPPDLPICGFDNEKCPVDNTSKYRRSILLK